MNNFYFFIHTSFSNIGNVVGGSDDGMELKLITKYMFSKNTLQKHMYENEKRAACKAFLENICLVISLSSFPSSEPQTTLPMLLKLGVNKEIKVVHGTHIVELIYIICRVAYTEDGDTYYYYLFESRRARHTFIDGILICHYLVSFLSF